MTDIEMETQDPRSLLAASLFRHRSLYFTPRSRRVAMELHHWIKHAKNPDGDDGLFVYNCCALSFDLSDHIITNYYAPVLHNFRPFFPELDSLVDDPIAYLRVVKKIHAGFEARNVIFSDSLLMGLQQDGLFTPSMVTAVAALRSSRTKVPILSRETLHMIWRAIERSMTLDSVRKKVDGFVDGRIGVLAPNLSALVGTGVAARLVGAAGGLSELSKMPVSDIKLLGYAAAKRKKLCYDEPVMKRVTCSPLLFEGYTQQGQLPDGVVRCFVGQTDIVLSTPPRLRSSACQCFAEAVNLVSTVDLNHTDMTGDKGRAIREEICGMIQKWKEEDFAAIMKMRTELAERPKKNKLAVSGEYSKMFKLNPNNKKKPVDIKRSKRRAKRAERVLASLVAFNLMES